jgi:hypothetical protein
MAMAHIEGNNRASECHDRRQQGSEQLALETATAQFDLINRLYRYKTSIGKIGCQAPASYQVEQAPICAIGPTQQWSSGRAAFRQICLMPIVLAIGGTAIVGCAVAAGI